MKNLKTILVLSFTIFANSGCQAQQNDEDKRAISVIKNFYVLYNTEWSTNHGLDKRNKLDSLMNLYCTRNLISEVGEQYLDHDMLIKDLYTTVDYLNTITVTKDSTRTATYIVSYDAPSEDPLGNDYVEKVIIYVTVVKEGESYKIDNVK